MVAAGRRCSAGQRKTPGHRIGQAAQRPQPFQRQPADQREQRKAAQETGHGQQAQLQVAGLPQQQRGKCDGTQAIGGQRHRLRRLLLTPDHAVVRNIAQLQNRRQREADQQQQADHHALRGRHPTGGRQALRDQIAQPLQQHEMRGETGSGAEHAGEPGPAPGIRTEPCASPDPGTGRGSAAWRRRPGGAGRSGARPSPPPPPPASPTAGRPATGIDARDPAWCAFPAARIPAIRSARRADWRPRSAPPPTAGTASPAAARRPASSR